MGRKAGALLWNRMRVVLQPGDNDIATGLIQVNQSFASESQGEPSYTQRIQVSPMAPTAAWAGVTHTEPFVNADGTIHVIIHNLAESPRTLNVLFWDPHSMVGPGDADPYGMIGV